MSIAFSRYIDGTDSAASTTAVVDFSACSVGDLAFVLISRDYHTVPTAPTNWTLLQSNAVSNTIGEFLYGKVLESGDIGSKTWTISGSVHTLATAAVYTGALLKSSAKGTYDAAQGTTVDCGSISSSETWLAQFCSVYAITARTYDALSGYTERREDGSTTSDFWHLLADTNGTWGGGACAPDFIISGGDASHRIGFIVELESSSGVTPPVLTAAQVGADIQISWE